MGNRNQFKREKKRERLEKGKFQKRCVFFCLPEILGKDKKKKKKKKILKRQRKENKANQRKRKVEDFRLSFSFILLLK